MLEEESGWLPDLLTLTCIALFAFIVMYALRQWIKGAQFTEKVSARGKVAIVTGSVCGLTNGTFNYSQQQEQTVELASNWLGS